MDLYIYIYINIFREKKNETYQKCLNYPRFNILSHMDVKFHIFVSVSKCTNINSME